MSGFGAKAERTFQSTFQKMTVYDWLRLIIIVGGYLLLRDRLMGLVRYLQGKNLEKEMDTEELERLHRSEESLKDKVHIPDDTDSDSEDEGKKTTDWGKTARRRQRRVIRAMLDQEEQRRKELDEDDEDKDIQEFLVD